MTIGEIQVGIERLRDHDAAKAISLEAWIDDVIRSWRVIPMEAQTFRRFAKMMHRRSDDMYEDAMIAATSFVHGLTVVTRNTKDFAALGVPVLNPFESPAG